MDNISVFRPWTFRCMKEGSIRIHCPFILLYWEHGLEPDSGPQGNAGIWKFAWQLVVNLHMAFFPHWYRSGNHLSAFGRAINNLKAKTKKKSLKPKLEALWCGWRDLNQYCAVLCQNAVLIIMHSYDFYKRFYSVTRAAQGAVKCKSAVKSAVQARRARRQN